MSDVMKGEVVANCALPSAQFVQPRWYAAYTISNHEKRVAARLEARSLQHFLPLYKSISKWKDRRALVHRPLFPGYVFVRLPNDSFLSVVEVPGVVRLVGFGGGPYQVPMQEIELLRAGLADGLDIQPHPLVKVGTRVRVCEGPLAGLEGILLRHNNSHRVILTVPVIERSAVVEVDARAIEYAH
jgi:transcription antitermination factor NusG